MKKSALRMKKFSLWMVTQRTGKSDDNSVHAYRRHQNNGTNKNTIVNIADGKSAKQTPTTCECVWFCHLKSSLFRMDAALLSCNIVSDMCVIAFFRDRNVSALFNIIWIQLVYHTQLTIMKTNKNYAQTVNYQCRIVLKLFIVFLFFCRWAHFFQFHFVRDFSRRT